MLKKIIAMMMATVVATTPVMASEYESPTGQRVVSNGLAEVQVEPDIAIISIGVTTENADSIKASEENSRITKNVIEVIKNMGIKDKDIQTSYYYSYENYNYDKDGNSNVVGYIYRNGLKIIVRDIDNVGSVLAEATKAGANSNNGISYDIEDKETYYDEALTIAIKQAVSKGVAMGNAVGYTNLNVSKIVENSSNVAYTESKVMENSLADSVSVPIEKGMISIRANVTVTME